MIGLLLSVLESTVPPIWSHAREFRAAENSVLPRKKWLYRNVRDDTCARIIFQPGIGEVG